MGLGKPLHLRYPYWNYTKIPFRMNKKIKIGLILQDTVVEQWIFKIIERLYKIDFAEVVLIINIGSRENASEKKSSLIFRLHELLDSWLYRGRYSYNSLIDISYLIQDSTKVSILVTEDYLLRPETVERALTKDSPHPDLLLNFSKHPVPNKVSKLVKYGVLTYKVEQQVYPGKSKAAYHSLTTAQPEVECFVTLISDGENEKVIGRSSVSIFSNSLNINLDRVLCLAELLIPRAVEWIYMSDNRLNKKLESGTSANDNPNLPIFVSPSSSDALRNLIKIQINSLKKKILYLDNEFWFLLFKRSDQFNPFNDKYIDFNKLNPPKGCYWADPFVICEQGRYIIFIEEYSYASGRGHLAVLQPDTNGRYQQSQVILRTPYHLSYPFVFKHEGIYYMIPETKSQKVIQIYRSKDFPLKWEFVTNLMEDVAAADSTVAYYSNKWWLFTSIDKLNNPAVSFGELFLFYTDDLFSGNWKSHPQNPIITDISQSRPAGKIFEHEGRLIRPAQDCSGGYGKAVNLNLIVTLNETDYEEKNITRITPDWDSRQVGMHTFNSAPGFYILDACTLRSRFS